MSEAIGTGTTARAQFRAGILAASGASLLVSGTLLGTLFGATALVVDRELPSPVVWFEFGAAALDLTAAWSVCSQHPGVAVGLAVAVVGLVLPEWAGWPALAASARASALAAAPFLVAGVAQVALRWPREATRSRALRVVCLLVSIAALIHLVAYDPSAEPGCVRICSARRPLIAGVLDTRSAVAIGGILIIAAAVVAVGAVLNDTPGPPPLVLGGVLAAIATLAVVQVLRWTIWTDSLGTVTLLLLLSFSAAAIVAAAVLITVARARRVRVAIVQLASRLSLGNAQLAAAMRARVAETQASQRRVVAASDAERRRIERDLHDGAQQRLVSAALYLSVARNRLHGGPPQLAETESAVRRALSQLRRIAHGAFPSLLTTEDLRGALDELTRGSAVPTTLTADQIDVDEETARAIYATVASAIGQSEHEWHATAARVAVSRQVHAVRLTIELYGEAPLLSGRVYTDAADRVGALGGTLTSTITTRGAIVEAVLPCAS